MDPPPARVAARLDPAQHDASGGRSQHDAPDRVDEEQPPQEHPLPADLGQPGRPRQGPCHEHAAGDPREPPQGTDGAHPERRGHLGDLGQRRDRRDRRVATPGRCAHRVEVRGEVGQHRVLVDVGDGHLGVALAQSRDELRGGEAAPTQVEEVLLRARGRRPQDRGVVTRDPADRPGELRLDTACRARGGGGQRPRQRLPVDLPGGAGRQRLDHGDPRHHRRRHRASQVLGGGSRLEALRCGHVPHEQAVPRVAALDGRRRAAHAGEREQGAVDLAELDPSPADLDLVVGPPLEDQAGPVEPHDVAAAVGPVPSEGGHRRVDGRVLLVVEVPRETHSADDQLAGLAGGDPVARTVDHREVPAVQGEADPHGRLTREPRPTGDDGRLGRPVGVPHLAFGGGEARPDLGRARLPTQDQQAHVVQGAGWPQRHERRHGRDHGDVVRDQPRPEVHPGAHEGAWGRDEAGAVPPGQPHLLAARVERHRQPGHDTVPGPDGLVLQEHPCLRVDEGRRTAMAHRDALGRAGGAGREDDPGVVAQVRVLHRGGRPVTGAGADHQVPRDDGGHAGLVEDQPGALVGVVVVDRHVRGTGHEDPDDGDVQVGRSRGDADADPVPAPDALVPQR